VTPAQDAEAFTANGGSGTISSFSVDLYNLTDGLHRLSGFRTGDDGSLVSAGTLPGLPVGAAAIAST
jgi:hypothetical protein